MLGRGNRYTIAYGTARLLILCACYYYCCCSLCHSHILGWLSDNYGRKPLLVFGLATSTVFTTTLFATSSVVIAVVSRTAAGLTDSTQSVAYAVIGKIPFESMPYFILSYDCLGDVGPLDVVQAMSQRALSAQWHSAYASAAFQIARMLSSVIGG